MTAADSTCRTRSANSNNGSYSFNNTGSTYGTGDPGLDFLLGVPATYTQGSGATIQASAWLNYIYMQDNWKATNTLTVAYGLGYSIDTPLFNHQYQGIGIDCFIVGEQSKVFPGAPKNMVYPGRPGLHRLCPGLHPLQRVRSPPRLRLGS